jgi:hypothetical protein
MAGEAAVFILDFVSFITGRSRQTRAAFGEFRMQPILAFLIAVTVITAWSFAANEPLEVGNPLGFATSMTNANNGDLLLMRGNRKVRLSDGGRTMGEPVEMSMSVSGVIRLDEKHLIARSGRIFHVSADDGAT